MTLLEALNMLGLTMEDIDNIHQIKRAFRINAKKLHPDSNGDSSTNEFEEVREAYELLCKYSCNKMDSVVETYTREIINVEQLIAIYDGDTIDGVSRKISKSNIHKNVFLDICVRIDTANRSIEESFKTEITAHDTYSIRMEVKLESIEEKNARLSVGGKSFDVILSNGFNNYDIKLKYSIGIKVCIFVSIE